MTSPNHHHCSELVWLVLCSEITRVLCCSNISPTNALMLSRLLC
jgi:hypothetical protein